MKGRYFRYLLELLRLLVLVWGFMGAFAALNLPPWTALIALVVGCGVHTLMLIGERGRRS